jgi:putative oxygen-independent coproporphyrinogen III oxidase
MTGFGVYVHVPFCARRCDYCDFATWTDRHHLMEAYAAACVTDLTRRSEREPFPAATSVFFGGGTPSLLPADLLVAILAAVPRQAGAEVTVECNPDTVDLHKLAGYRDAGVTRISLGVQSMVPHVLEALGRTHDPDNVARAVDAIRAAGFETFNLDLIYGSVGESLADWARTLAEAGALSPPHVSAYGLTVEAGTPLAADESRHPDDDVQADMYVAADEALTAHGLHGYEISNWAQPGHECRHNILYWTQGDYRGFGCSAHSHESGRRFWNVRTPERYLDLVERGEQPVGGEEVLDADTRAFEREELALRTRDGASADAIVTDGLDGLVERRGDRVVLTRNGRLLANEVALRIRTAPA